jgi:hypothetical protein
MKALNCSTLLLFSTAMLHAAEGDIATLIDKVTSAYGGKAALERAVAFREEGHVEATVRVGSSGQITRVFARPTKLRVEIGPQDKPTEVRVLDGSKGWRGGKEVTGMSYEAMVLQATRLDLPLQLLRHKDRLVEKEAIDHDGKRLRVLELPLEGGLKLTAGIEPETGRILFSSGTTSPTPASPKPDSDSHSASGTGASAGGMGPAKFETSYADFRLVEGVLFAFKETNFAQGTKTADINLDKIELLKTTPSEAFKP